MKTILNIVKWDFVLVAKYGIVSIASVIACIYCISLLLIDTTGLENIVTVLIFSDPVMYGFLFTAIMILFEKDANIHQALAISPISASQYIWSKTIVFTTIALVYSTAIVLATQPQYFNPLAFFLGVTLSSTLFIFIGIIGASFVKNFNQFILLMPIVLAPVCLPFLDFFTIYQSPVFYGIPTQACLLLFKGSMIQIEIWQFVYAIIYLSVCNILCYNLALRFYKKRILNISRHE